MGEERSYTPDEVTAIVASALRRHRERQTVSHQELLETAAELGISREAVEEAARHLTKERDMEMARRKWMERQRVEYRSHLASYIIVNSFLMLIDLTTGEGWWFWWAALAWGIGLAFHTYAVFFPDPDEVERGARQILAREHRTQSSSHG